MASPTLIAPNVATCNRPFGMTVGPVTGIGRLSASKVSSRAVATAPTAAGRPPAAAGTMLSRPITPTSNAFDALGTATVVSASMASARAAFVGPVTDAAVMPIAFKMSVRLHRSDECHRRLQRCHGGRHAGGDQRRADERAVDDLIAQKAGQQPAGRNLGRGQPDIARYRRRRAGDRSQGVAATRRFPRWRFPSLPRPRAGVFVHA